MTRSNAVRAAMAVSGAAAATVARADGAAGITSTGWLSILGVVCIGGVLYWVFKKIG